MIPDISNIKSDIPQQIPEEIFQTLFTKDNFKIERIISQGQSTPSKQWYDQVQDEWIILLEGQAIIEFENTCDNITLNSGDYLLIPAHRKHRVEWTDPTKPTIWLAIHIYPKQK